MEKGITRIKVVKMYDKCSWGDGIDHQARELNGKTLVYDCTDDSGQLWCNYEDGSRCDLALIPGIDEFVVL